MTILELIQGDGLFTKRVGSTGGGEYAGPCPWCGGRDRFRVWPNQGEAGKYWCRQCGQSGDSIQYLRDYRGLDFKVACEYLGRNLPQGGPVPSKPAGKPAWEPRACSSPGELWLQKARYLAREAVYFLWSLGGQAALRFLQEERGLQAGTIKGFGLGWIPGDRWAEASAWGLPQVLKDNGRTKKLWIPKGLTIPLLQGGQVVRLRVRRPEGEPRYYVLRGSSSAVMIIGHGSPVLVVEAELDAVLLHQAAGDLVTVAALGNAQARPDRQAAELLSKAPLILVSLDADQAGAKEAWRWWTGHYHQARRWPPIQGKDPGDMRAAGVDLRLWVRAGLVEYGAA